MDELPFRRMPDAPPLTDAAGVLTRLCDAIGFRFYWATESLRVHDWDFRPGPESMSIAELERHLAGLLRRIAMAFCITVEQTEASDVVMRRKAVLQLCERLREGLLRIDERALAAVVVLPALIHGPLSDALSHIGQIAAFRRLAGNPAPRVDYFRAEVRDRDHR
jgi:hypothetical protein